MELTCEECVNKETTAKYKCPKCRTPYCSVTCCKKHKLNGCKPSSINNENGDDKQSQSSHYQYPTEDTIPIEKLQLLRHNKKLLDIVNNPHLRTIMEAINSSENPTELIHEAMLEPIFVEFADECLKVVQDTENFS